MRKWVLSTLTNLFVITCHVYAVSSEEISLTNKHWMIKVQPDTLKMTAFTGPKSEVVLSQGQPGLGVVSNLVRNDNLAEWNLKDETIRIVVGLHERDFSVAISSEGAGSFIWPVLRFSKGIKALIWPRAEGVYVPLDDSRWVKYMVGFGELNTLESLSMPFWGLDCGGFSLTYIVINPYNNTIQFELEGDSLGARFTHEFTRFLTKKEYGFRIHLGDIDSPVEPAKQFRHFLHEQKAFVSMQEKIKRVPKVARLLGAAHVYLWGDGVSIKMLDRFRDNGLDKMRFCVSGWEAVEKRPDVAKQADAMGYLFGTYDSYHSVHDPAIRGTDQTWPTAQFDKELFEKGPIVRKDGTKWWGFKKVGCKLSPIAARPYVEKRVSENMNRVPYSYYFVDCDATGEVYDDYSPLHPTGQADDVKERVHRLAWISETFRVVIGSEGGNSYAAGVLHVAEGIFGPLFGWGDPDLKDRDSKYYLGGYYPPEGPRIFVQQVPMKEEYQYFYYDPRFRLPLYEIVFHDSVVTTHHWQNGSLKFDNVVDTVALTELLYMVPPMYHMNLDEFEKHREAMKKHYAFFSPLHREVGFSQMTDFHWLSSDRLLQCATFADKIEIAANFSTETRQYNGLEIPGHSIAARWRESGQTRSYTARYSP